MLSSQACRLGDAEAVVCLKYLDESGCCPQSPTDYGYGKRGEQKRIRGRKWRGRRINILGVWQPQVRFDYALMVGTLKTSTFLKLMDWQAALAEQQFNQTGQLSVIVLYNASVHRSKLSQQQHQRWQQQGLILFFLPPYSPQMNRIEEEWLHLKRDELASRVFEDEVDLADAIIAAIDNRGRNGAYIVERFSLIRLSYLARNLPVDRRNLFGFNRATSLGAIAVHRCEARNDSGIVIYASFQLLLLVRHFQLCGCLKMECRSIRCSAEVRESPEGQVYVI